MENKEIEIPLKDGENITKDDMEEGSYDVTKGYKKSKRDIELENKVEELNQVDLMVIELMDLIITILANIPDNLNSEDVKIKLDKLTDDIERFGPLLNSICEKMRKQFEFFETQSLGEKNIPIKCARKIFESDRNLWEKLVTYLAEETEDMGTILVENKNENDSDKDKGSIEAAIKDNSFSSETSDKASFKRIREEETKDNSSIKKIKNDLTEEQSENEDDLIFRYVKW